jgi:hypothetical protein
MIVNHNDINYFLLILQKIAQDSIQLCLGMKDIN